MDLVDNENSRSIQIMIIFNHIKEGACMGHSEKQEK